MVAVLALAVVVVMGALAGLLLGEALISQGKRVILA
jgi:hypothetical protein